MASLELEPSARTRDPHILDLEGKVAAVMRSQAAQLKREAGVSARQKRLRLAVGGGAEQSEV